MSGVKIAVFERVLVEVLRYFQGNETIWNSIKSDLIAMHSNIEVLSTWSLAVEQTQSQAANSSAGSLSDQQTREILFHCKQL